MNAFTVLLRFGLGTMFLGASVVFAAQGFITLAITVMSGGDVTTDIPWPVALLELVVAYFAFKHAKLLLWNPGLLREVSIVMLFVVAVYLGGQGAAALMVYVVSWGEIAAIPWPVAILELIAGYWLFGKAKRLNATPARIAVA